ncbi:hypothetical protein HPB50_008005 [Hyalomma asiaticum]|uniref:Uncharacterized protein n=2 Tax=Hyalomma asiaticum TaxID=266040 RepID=A0ACB7SLD5_HYAAI|nr:hypothetical protein HPB50_008005 [Hyalomma asiaticum]
MMSSSLFALMLLVLLAYVLPRGGLCCRTEHFPIPSQCGSEGGIPPGGAHSLPWMVTVRVEAMTDVQDSEDLLPCPSVFQSAAREEDGLSERQARGGPDSFFGHLARVAVTHKMTSTCAGAVVTERHVLTAAHCLFASRYKPTYRVFLRNGSSAAAYARTYVSVPVVAALYHPGCRFHGTTRAVNDLAVLVLAEPIDIQGSGGVRALCLPWPDVPVYGSVLWMARHEGRAKGGSTGGGAGRLPTALTRESVQLVNCSLLPQMAHDTGGEPSMNELCAVSMGGLRDVVDPGTALMVDTVQGWVLVGLLSWLYDARAVSSVAVFTDVRGLMAWLLETLFKTF